MTEDAVVIGGGPAGAIAAWHLARAGRSPLVIEREAQPIHRMCGEFVSFEAQDAMREIGVDPLALGAQPIDRLRLIHRASAADVLLPFTAMGLGRKTMDAALLSCAENAGARVRRIAAKRIDGMSVETDGGPIAARALVLATGKHDLRGAGRDPAGTMADLVGFKMHYRLDATQRAALAGHIEVTLFDGGYAGLQMIEDGIANLCLLVGRRRLAAVGKQWRPLIESLADETPHLAERLSGAAPLFERPLTIAGVPYGFRYHPSADDSPRLYRTGDQMAVIPSFAGDGMAIAMTSGRAAAMTVIGGRDAREWHGERRRLLARQLGFASALHRLGRPAGVQAALIGMAKLWPGLVRHLALWTRVPAAARGNSRSLSGQGGFIAGLVETPR